MVSTHVYGTGLAGARPHARLVMLAATTAGFAGAVAITAGSVVAGLGYSGTAGQSFSPLNHWISELGQLGVSSWAAVFNAALVVGGLSLVVFMLGLAAAVRGRLRFLFGPLGAIAGVGAAFVGAYPMNYVDAHTIAAQTFFNLGWIAIAIASIEFVRHPDARFPRWLSVVGALTVIAFVSFLAVYYGPAEPTGRAAVRLVTTLEWLVLIGIVAWVFLVAWTWRRAPAP